MLLLLAPDAVDDRIGGAKGLAERDGIVVDDVVFMDAEAV